MSETGKRVVIWCAVSSREQAKDEKISLPEQERLLRAKFTEADGWQIVDTLIIPGFSRRYYNFPEFMHAALEEGIEAPRRLMQLWQTNGFDVFAAAYASRFGREQAIFAEVVTRTIDMGARLYTLRDGWIDKSNYRFYVAMAGHEAASSVDRLMEYKEAALSARAAAGLNPGSSIVMSHRLIRDDMGRALSIELDERYHQLWQDAARLLIGDASNPPLPWLALEAALYDRFGHVDPATGRAFSPQTIYRVMHNPVFWGHIQRHRYSPKILPKMRLAARWAYDPSFEPPAGVEVYYNRIPAVFTGELAARVIAEMRRRAELSGTARPDSTNAYSGLVFCDHCSYSMAYNSKNDRNYQTYRCITNYPRHQRTGRPYCDAAPGRIFYRDLQDWTHLFLRNLLAADDPLAHFAPASNVIPLVDTTALENQLEAARDAARLLLRKQVPDSLAALHEEEMHAVGERITILEARLHETQSQHYQREITHVNLHAALDDLRAVGLSGFWSQSDTRVNQLLRRLFGEYRIFVRNGEVYRVAKAPPHFGRA